MIQVLWRLAVNGVPAGGGHDISFKGPCGCGWVGPHTSCGGDASSCALALRMHAFWDCPVASAVVAELARALPGHDIRCADVWLLRSPSGSDVHDCVWAVVAMVALSAMAYGRAALWHMSFDES